jgi:hypothetical protein
MEKVKAVLFAIGRGIKTAYYAVKRAVIETKRFIADFIYFLKHRGELR